MPQPKSKRQTMTAPKPKSEPPSKLWVPTLMFSLLGVGVFVIVANYFGILPGEQNNWYLLLGIGEVTAGFVAATAVR